MSSRKPKKLSTAIRQGIKLDGPKIKNAYIKVDGKGAVLGTCALGAAGVALLGKSKLKELILSTVQDVKASNHPYHLYGEDTQGECKTCISDISECVGDSLSDVVDKFVRSLGHEAEEDIQDLVVNLNDEQGWSRERIADKVEKLGL